MAIVWGRTTYILIMTWSIFLKTLAVSIDMPTWPSSHCHSEVLDKQKEVLFVRWTLQEGTSSCTRSVTIGLYMLHTSINNKQSTSPNIYLKFWSSNCKDIHVRHPSEIFILNNRPVLHHKPFRVCMTEFQKGLKLIPKQKVVLHLIIMMLIYCYVFVLFYPPPVLWRKESNQHHIFCKFIKLYYCTTFKALWIPLNYTLPQGKKLKCTSGTTEKSWIIPQNLPPAWV